VIKDTKDNIIKDDDPILNRLHLMESMETHPVIKDYVELVRVLREHGIWEDLLYQRARELKNLTQHNNIDLNISDYSMFLEDGDYEYWTPVTQGMDQDSYEYKVKICRFLWILSRFPEYKSRDWEFLLAIKDKLVFFLRECEAKGKMWDAN